VFTFAIAAGVKHGVPNVERVNALMEWGPLRAPDGRRLVESPHAAAAVDRWIVVRRDEWVGPTWDRERGLLFAGDVRLYNRPEIIAALDAAPASLSQTSDLELARLAYLKWGDLAPRHLVGDFAFAAWRERERTLFCTRDHFGVRPLYYRILPDGFVVASDVNQILALVERPFDEVSPHRLLSGLTRRHDDIRRTHFRGIVRVAPGSTITLVDGIARETRYWLPRQTLDGNISYGENCERVRLAFKRAVHDRLESDCPIVAHSSGGFDSSSILMAADEIYRSGCARPPLIMASGVAPGFPSDESHLMDAVAARVAFEGVRLRESVGVSCWTDQSHFQAFCAPPHSCGAGQRVAPGAIWISPASGARGS
jgi:asparagine synthetase B (glutamine-hydrolysing)